MSKERLLLTPTEELILEVLIARHRLGENLWPFGRNQSTTRAARGLEGKGLIHVKSGQVEHTFQASLTEMGKQMYLRDSYVRPILKNETRKIVVVVDGKPVVEVNVQ